MNRSLPILAALSFATFAAQASAQDIDDTSKSTVVADSFNSSKKETTNVDVDTKVEVDDSFNTKRESTKVDDSFNTKKESTKIDDSYNSTKNETTKVDVDDSFNTKKESTKIDDSYNTTKKESTKIDDSYNKYEDNDTIKKESTKIEDSYNKSDSTKIDDSYNTTKKESTKIDDSYNTTKKESTKIEDSYNKTETTKIDDSFNKTDKTEDSYNKTVKIDDSFNKHDESTHLNNVLNNLSIPVANTDLQATIAHNEVLNLNLKSDVGNVKIDDAFSGARGINSMNTNTGAHSIQQVGVSISVVQHTTK